MKTLYLFAAVWIACISLPTHAAAMVKPTINNDGRNTNKKPMTCEKRLEEEETKRAAIRKDMLELFGKDNRPNPDLFGHLGRNTASAKKYMYNLYKSSVTADCIPDIQQSNVTSEVMKDADTVVSFVNTNCKLMSSS